eukprot:COSAG01_NODE_1127_length_11588_cov_18.279050_10_plen_65_part_00
MHDCQPRNLDNCGRPSLAACARQPPPPPPLMRIARIASHRSQRAAAAAPAAPSSLLPALLVGAY